MASPRMPVSLLFFLAVVVCGTIGFHFIEDFSWATSTYFTIVTITTVGYGDIAPQTDAGRLFSIPVIILGVYSGISTLTYLFGSVLEYRVRRAISGIGKPREFKNHVIVAGTGSLADIVLRELDLNKIPYAWISREPIVGRDEAIMGDPSDEATLLKAEHS